jgi:hypothetical protein
MFAAPDDLDAIDKDVVYPLGLCVKPVIFTAARKVMAPYHGPAAYGRGIEDDNVRTATLADHAAIDQAEIGGRPRSELVDRGLYRHDRMLSHPLAENHGWHIEGVDEVEVCACV